MVKATGSQREQCGRSHSVCDHQFLPPRNACPTQVDVAKCSKRCIARLYSECTLDFVFVFQGKTYHTACVCIYLTLLINWRQVCFFHSCQARWCRRNLVFYVSWLPTLVTLIVIIVTRPGVPDEKWHICNCFVLCFER